MLLRRGGSFILPLFLLAGLRCQKSSSSISWQPETQPPYLLDSIKVRLYPLVAGAHAAKDSIRSYRWELWMSVGETLYFGLSRPARSLYPHRREAVVGRAILRDTGFTLYEELFWTYRFHKDTIRALTQSLFQAWRKGISLDTFQTDFIAFPDPYSFYDVHARKWRRIVGKDTIDYVSQLVSPV
ncbi:MAG: hypothetical protein NZ580_02645 [Bacteroidia bacterium]|nr:hypothetical protein [Bacteroidia bacterium]MDW8235685.1 hypothetical protein [Bacteroidia bacterium]